MMMARIVDLVEVEVMAIIRRLALLGRTTITVGIVMVIVVFLLLILIAALLTHVHLFNLMGQQVVIISRAGKRFIEGRGSVLDVDMVTLALLLMIGSLLLVEEMLDSSLMAVAINPDGLSLTGRVKLVLIS